LGVPATALGAAPGNPKVIRIDPSTGTRTVLAGGAPWTNLTGVAVGPSGIVYVANQGPPPDYTQGAGIYSLTAPGFAVTPFPTPSTTVGPRGLIASGSTLYALEQGVLSVDTSAPFTQRVVSAPAGEHSDDATYTPDPDFAALSGSTLYGTSWIECNDDSAEPGGSWLVAIDTTTGKRTQVVQFGCDRPQGIAAAPDGSLLIAIAGAPAAKIIRFNPADSSVKTVSSGGALKDPRGVALARQAISWSRMQPAACSASRRAPAPNPGSRRVLNSAGPTAWRSTWAGTSTSPLRAPRHG
jgi:hypothetical protein